MLKKIISMVLALSLVTVMLPAYALESDSTDLLTDAFQIGGETISYKYKEKDGIISYVEVEGNVIENIDNEIFLNGVKFASYTETYTGFTTKNSMSPRFSWMWSTTGNRNDYSYEGSITRDLALEAGIATVGVGVLSGIILLFLPEKAVAAKIAAVLIDGVVGAYSLYANSKHIFTTEDTYRHNSIPLNYAKMVDHKYYYDEDLTKENTDAAKTLYGSWG